MIELSGPDRPDDLQATAGILADEWLQHDAVALQRLTPEQVEAQGDLRLAMYTYVRDYWNASKESHDVTAPEWQAVAGIVDLFDRMLANSNAVEGISPF